MKNKNTTPSTTNIVSSIAQKTGLSKFIAPSVVKNITVKEFKDNLIPINNQQTQIIHQKTETYFQTLVAKMKTTKLFTTSFVTGKPIINGNVNSTVNSKNFTDVQISNYLKNINTSNIPPHLQTESNQALNYYYHFCVELRNLLESGNNEQIQSFISSFYSPSNPFSGYFRGEMYNLIKSIHDCSSYKNTTNTSSKDFAYGIYKILDPSFDGNSLNNLFIYENSSNTSKTFQQVHELLDSIDLARSAEFGIEIHLTNDNDWNEVLNIAKIDSSYQFLGKKSQLNMDVLIIDRINKVYYARDFKTRFWLNGFPLNTDHIFNLGNVPEYEKICIEIAQKNELLKNLKNKLKSPNLTDEQRDAILSQISVLSKSKVPIDTFRATLPHINTGKNSNAAISAVIFNTGVTPDRDNVPLGLNQTNITDVIA